MRVSSIPGMAYADLRRPSVSRLTLANAMPLSAVWAVPENTVHLDGPPLIVTRTDGATLFRLVTHIGDVGHTVVAGPTGMGKSVLLATLAMPFRPYRGSRIFVFAMGRSLRAQIGRDIVRPPVTNAPTVCRLMLGKKTQSTIASHHALPPILND